MALSLVTGADGFLGRYLCRELIQRGDEVIALTRAPTNAPEAHFVLSSKPKASEICKAIDETSADFVYHLAGTSNSSDIEVLYQANVIYAQSVLCGAASAKTPPKVLIVGSAAEYGPPVSIDMHAHEEDVCRPISAYGISKLAQTHHGLAASRDGLHVTIARLFNPIGVGSPGTTALGSFVRQLSAATGQFGVLKTGSLHSVRDFIGVSEAARIITVLPTLPATRGQVYNVCTGSGVKLQEIVEQLIDVSGIHVDHRVEDHRRGTSDLDVVIGSNKRLQALGLNVQKPDIRSLLGVMLAHARSQMRTSAT